MDAPIFSMSKAHKFSCGAHNGPDPQAGLAENGGKPGHRLLQMASDYTAALCHVPLDARANPFLLGLRSRTDNGRNNSSTRPLTTLP